MSQSLAMTSQGVTIVGRFVRAVSSTVTAGGAGTGTFARAAGSWLTDGLTVGMRFTSTHAGNAGPFTITAVTALVVTVAETTVLVGSAVSATYTISVPLGEVTDFTGPGGSANDIDTTHLGSTSREFRVGLRESGEVTLEMNFVPGQVGQVYLRRLQGQITAAASTFVMTMTDTLATTATFLAFVREFTINGSVDEKISASVTLRITGDVTWSDVT